MFCLMLLLFGAVVFISGTDPSNICESITEEDFLQELENPTF